MKLGFVAAGSNYVAVGHKLFFGIKVPNDGIVF